MQIKEKNKIYTIDTERLHMRILQPTDHSERYLGWLNDPEVQKYTRRHGRTSTMQDVDDFIKYTLDSLDFHFAIFVRKDNVHIGNISLNSVDVHNHSAELSIMLGDRAEWGKGYAREAIAALADFAFTQIGLHRVWAESCNPSFISLMKKMGWPEEGVRREAIRMEDQYLDYIDWGVLRSEWPLSK